MKQIFFQSSLPRSGSTLLQNIIGQNPDFYVTPTSGVLELVFGARHNYTNSPEFKAQDTDIMSKGFKGFCKAGLHGFFDAITDKPYVLDKSRGWGYYQSFIHSFYPNPKIICMVRDPRAIMSSMEKQHRKHSIERTSSIVNDQDITGITIHQRVIQWSTTQPVGLAFERLRDIFARKLYKNMLFVRYEDLTKNPQKQLERIYTYLDLPQYPHNFNNINQITQEDDSVYGIYGNHTIKSAVEPNKNDYNIILGSDVCEQIIQHYKWFYDIFNYIVE